MKEKQSEMLIKCPKCSFETFIKFPVEVQVFINITDGLKAIHQHNNECFEDLIARGADTEVKEENKAHDGRKGQ